MKFLDDPDQAVAALRVMEGLVVLDGCTGAGKSTLMHEIALRLGCTAIEVDHFVRKRQGFYVNAVRVDSLRKRIEEALRGSKLVLLDAVCARAVVECVPFRAAAFIYVQRVSRTGVVYDYHMVLADEDGVSAEVSYFSELDNEILRYHARYRPISTADFVYRRPD